MIGKYSCYKEVGLNTVSREEEFKGLDALMIDLGFTKKPMSGGLPKTGGVLEDYFNDDFDISFLMNRFTEGFRVREEEVKEGFLGSKTRRLKAIDSEPKIYDVILMFVSSKDRESNNSIVQSVRSFYEKLGYQTQHTSGI